MFRGRPGERGQLGDHGQDGRQGPRGERGPGPTPAEVAAAADGIEDVREALAHVLAEKTRKRDEDVDRHLRLVDRRLLITYAVVTTALALALLQDERSDRRDARADALFQRQVVSQCETNNAGNAKVNEALALLERNALSNPARTEAERQRIAEQYASLKLPITKCPPAD